MWSRTHSIVSAVACVLGLSAGLLASPSANAGVNGELLMSQDQFVSQDFEATDRRSFTYLGARLKSEESATSLNGFRADIVGQYAAGASVMSYLNVSELYWSESGFSLGRRRVEWSHLDSTWSMGLFEPVFRQNPLSPEGQGLSGFFLKLGNEDWSVDLFASFLFIPDQGPGYELKNGSFEKANPWFQTPPSYIHFYGQTDKVNYNVQRPETNDIIFNRSFAGSARLGSLTDGLSAQVGVASKPSNQLALGFSGFLAANNTAQVQVNPKVFYHNLVSADLAYNNSWLSGGVSGLIENPKAPDYSNDLTYAVYRASTLLSPYLDFKRDRNHFLISYLKVQGGEPVLSGDQQSAIGSSQNTVLADRYPFREALMLKGSLVQKISRKKYLDLEAQYLRGDADLFSVWTLGAGYKWDAYWKATARAQLVAAKDSPEADRTTAGQFQNNDSLVFGVSYVF